MVGGRDPAPESQGLVFDAFRVHPQLASEVERHLTYDLDLAAQGLQVLRALKRHAGKGVWSAPELLDILPDNCPACRMGLYPH